MSQYTVLHPFPVSVTGIGIGTSSLNVQGIGFDIKDDTGHCLSVAILNSIYFLNIIYILLCPQHCIQETGSGTKIESNSKSCGLVWKGKFTKMVQFTSTMNVPTFFSVAGPSIHSPQRHCCVHHSVLLPQGCPNSLVETSGTRFKQVLGQRKHHCQAKDQNEEKIVAFGFRRSFLTTEGAIVDPLLVHHKRALIIDFVYQLCKNQKQPRPKTSNHSYTGIIG